MGQKECEGEFMHTREMYPDPQVWNSHESENEYEDEMCKYVRGRGSVKKKYEGILTENEQDT